MGSISRVNISYMSFDDVFSKNLNLVASDIKGTNINEYKFNKNQLIFFGNEANGLSQKVLSEVRNKINPMGSRQDARNTKKSIFLIKLGRW